MGREMLRVRILAGVNRADIEAETGALHPIIVGGMNEDSWSHDPDESERQIERWKMSFDPSGEFEWREFWIEVWESEVAGLFTTETLQGYVEAGAANSHPVTRP